MGRRTFNDEGQEATFLENGYVIVPFLNSDEINLLKDGFARLRPDDSFIPGEGGINQSDYHCTFLDTNVNYKKDVDQLIRKVFSKGIERFLNDYSILTSNFYVKQPNKGQFEIHQNWPTLENLDQYTLTIWAPLHNTDIDNGTIHVVPRSHKLIPYIQNIYYPAYFKSFEQQLKTSHLIPLNLNVGEAVIFCDTLIHWSPANKSENPRIAVQIETVPEEEQPIFYYYDKAKPDQFEMFKTESDFFINNTIQTFLTRPDHLEFAGYKQNPNTEVSYNSFLELLEKRS